jgi:hypothetical protein
MGAATWDGMNEDGRWSLTGGVYRAFSNLRFATVTWKGDGMEGEMVFARGARSEEDLVIHSGIWKAER